MTVGLAVADDRFDGRAPPEFPFDLAVHTALLARPEDPKRLRRLMAHITLVDIDPLDLAAGQRLSFLNNLAERMAVIRVAGQRLGMQDELPAFAAFVGCRERNLDAELVRPMGLALADALGLGRVPGIEFPAALPLFLTANLSSARQRDGEDLLQVLVAFYLAPDVADQAAQPGAQKFDLAVVAFELLGVSVLRFFVAASLCRCRKPHAFRSSARVWRSSFRYPGFSSHCAQMKFATSLAAAR